jgi:hypothetical protein
MVCHGVVLSSLCLLTHSECGAMSDEKVIQQGPRVAVSGGQWLDRRGSNWCLSSRRAAPAPEISQLKSKRCGREMSRHGEERWHGTERQRWSDGHDSW